MDLWGFSFQKGERFRIMVIHWLSLIGGLFFGLIPPRMLIQGECRFLMFEELWTKVLRPPPGAKRRRRWWKLPLVWIDPLRGYATAFFLMQAFANPPPGSGQSVTPALVARTVVPLLCLWVQTSGRRRAGETISPMGFLAGMLVVLLPWSISIPVLIVGASSVVAVRNYAYGYLAGAMMCAGFGYLFMGVSLKLIAPLALLMLPIAVNWMRGTRLVVPVRC